MDISMRLFWQILYYEFITIDIIYYCLHLDT